MWAHWTMAHLHKSRREPQCGSRSPSPCRAFARALATGRRDFRSSHPITMGMNLRTYGLVCYARTRERRVSTLVQTTTPGIAAVTASRSWPFARARTDRASGRGPAKTVWIAILPRCTAAARSQLVPRVRLRRSSIAAMAPASPRVYVLANRTPSVRNRCDTIKSRCETLPIDS
jgi:hypothetical protein